MNDVPPPPDTCLIHVGKCGGTTICSELLQRGVTTSVVHVAQPPVSTSTGYWFLARDPIDRFVSAYRWRRHVFAIGRLREPDGSLNARNAAELEYLTRHPRIDDVALSTRGRTYQPWGPIAERGPFLIGHVAHGFSWHYDDLLDHITPSQVLGVIAQETLDDDCEAVFGFRPTLRENADYAHEGGELSATGRALLAEQFTGEYATLRRLARIADEGGAHVPASLRALALQD